MRRPDDFRLIFLLPPALHLSVLPGRHQPCIAGCVLTIDRLFVVSIDGPSRERVFEQARRFLKLAAKQHGPLSIAAVLSSPGKVPGRDSWTIIVGADVAFSPTSLPPDLGARDATGRAGDNVVKLVSSR